MKFAHLPIYCAVGGFCTVGLVCLVARDLRGPRPVGPKLIEPAAVMAQAEQRPAMMKSRMLPIMAEIASVPTPAPVLARSSVDGHYEQLRINVRWVQTRLGTGQFATPDYHSRLLLAKSAAHRAGLAEVGLGYHDVYGIITAETSWVPRLGQSKNGTPNLGIAQFEPATARLLGLRNPNDLVESIHVAAVHMKEAALWSASRIEGLRLSPGERAAKLREGVSIYYNLSSRGRAVWNGRNTARLPIETQRHIANARIGAREAALLDGQLRAMRYGQGRPVMTASALRTGG
ncbi:lytic transglycosylase domain-containing protein [Ramlibacter sp. WS9]|uniref:lytic transglycosylase domain-containing protein n=1 Tax=Ramlibacter sp. WS9 TaxID=1882741 RepID=UPI001144D2C3|nr:lytic transglycosylase domain-containing protein [Ramlibacter sp. WS9]ROZ72475.1 lytic transglycosylase domain-containing protein [Ramlibacter sp. WS9]